MLEGLQDSASIRMLEGSSEATEAGCSELAIENWRSSALLGNTTIAYLHRVGAAIIDTKV